MFPLLSEAIFLCLCVFEMIEPIQSKPFAVRLIFSTEWPSYSSYMAAVPQHIFSIVFFLV